MWILKLKLDSKNQFLGNMAVKHRVSMTGYPLSYWKDESSLFVVTAGFVFGEKKNIDSLFKDLKKQNEVLEIERTGEFSILVTKQPLFAEPVYNPKVIRPNPVIINKEGHHIWDLASFDRKMLEEVLAFAEKYLGAKIIHFKQEKISNISFTRLLPELTKNQKRAMEIAINRGYYDYPKKITLEELAKMIKISYSTYQQHLKTAEGKIVPAVYKEL